VFDDVFFSLVFIKLCRYVATISSLRMDDRLQHAATEDFTSRRILLVCLQALPSKVSLNRKLLSNEIRVS
jgi:hypothetical protein